MSLLTNLTVGTVLIVSLLSILSIYSWMSIFRLYREWKESNPPTSETALDLQGLETLESIQSWHGPFMHGAYLRMWERAAEVREELRENQMPGAGIRPADQRALEISLRRIAGQERARLILGISWLAVIATVAPLLGLLGTVTGIMNTFIGIQASGVTSIAAIVPGVSEALITTVAGLLVAIPAAVAHGTFTARADEAEEGYLWFSADLVNIVSGEIRR